MNRETYKNAVPADCLEAAALGHVSEAVMRTEELERLQALLIATVGHELRTPLTVLRAHIDLSIMGYGAFSPSQIESLRLMSDATDRLQTITDRLIADLRRAAGGAEVALGRWLECLPPDSP